MTFDVDEDFILKRFTTFSLLIPCGGDACGKRGLVACCCCGKEGRGNMQSQQHSSVLHNMKIFLFFDSSESAAAGFRIPAM